MLHQFTKLPALAATALLLALPALLHADNMEERIHTAIHILKEKQESSDPIPASLLNHARGIAIFTVTQGGLGIGGKGGEGIAIVRLGAANSRSWAAPCAFNLAGASIGAQIGFTEDSYIVVLNTDEAVRHFTSNGKTSLNATASGTAGSTTATEKATTTELEHREIVIYKATGGLFGGATLGGTSIERKNSVNQEAYGDTVRAKNILNGTVPPPESAGRLYRLLNGNVSHA